ncbi:MAG: ATP-dependent zinc protease [Pseudomonadota bacterium]
MVEQQHIELGWREWVALPELGLDAIKAKVDTGARTSTLHAFEVAEYKKGGASHVRFQVHPNQKDNDTVVVCHAPVVDRRRVSDSGGHREWRWVIVTDLLIGAHEWSIEMTLTARDNMLFRMLLGRTAMRGRAIVDPARSYLVGTANSVGR